MQERLYQLLDQKESEFSRWIKAFNSYSSKEVKKEYSDLFKSNKGIVFKILRKVFLGQALYSYEGTEGIGELTITFNSGSDIYNLMIKAAEAFGLLYKLNYMLWKVGDLKRKVN